MALCFTLPACNQDTSGSESGLEGGTGCHECGTNLDGPFGCECKVGSGNWAPLPGNQDFCVAQGQDQTAYCDVQCDSYYTQDVSGRTATATCTDPIVMDCSGWHPNANVSLVNGVYRVNRTWFDSLVADPTPLWGCDNITLSPVSNPLGFQVGNANAGEFLYAIGLRNGDRPQTLNGIALTSFSSGYVAFALYLNGVTTYTLVVKRGGANVTLTIKLV